MINDLGKSLEELGKQLQGMESSLDNVLSSTLEQLQGEDKERFRIFQAKVTRLKNKALKGESITNDLEKLKNEHTDNK